MEQGVLLWNDKAWQTARAYMPVTKRLESALHSAGFGLATNQRSQILGCKCHYTSVADRWLAGLDGGLRPYIRGKSLTYYNGDCWSLITFSGVITEHHLNETVTLAWE